MADVRLKDAKERGRCECTRSRDRLGKRDAILDKGVVVVLHFFFVSQAPLLVSVNKHGALDDGLQAISFVVEFVTYTTSL